MRVLVTWGTKLGGTEGIARIIADVLGQERFDVVAAPASSLRDAEGFDAAIVGGALYAGRWHADARRFVARNAAALRRIPVWFFSSGPLDHSADRGTIQPTTQVAVLMERIGARGHVTFGGRLPADARGFPAASMAKKHSGDWRDPAQIRAWASGVARDLPTATPVPFVDHPARSPWRLVAYALAGWALCAASLIGLLAILSAPAATLLRALLAPVLFAVLSARYFRARGAREPVPTAALFATVFTLLDWALTGRLLPPELHPMTSVTATWLPVLLVFLVTSATGFIVSTMPWPKPARPDAQAPHATTI